MNKSAPAVERNEYHNKTFCSGITPRWTGGCRERRCNQPLFCKHPRDHMIFFWQIQQDWLFGLLSNGFFFIVSPRSSSSWLAAGPNSIELHSATGYRDDRQWIDQRLSSNIQTSCRVTESVSPFILSSSRGEQVWWCWKAIQEDRFSVITSWQQGRFRRAAQILKALRKLVVVVPLRQWDIHSLRS